MDRLCERFAPLMAETLHFAGSPDGLSVSLNDANARLCALAEQERSASPFDGLSGDGTQPHELRRELELARFAVAAWADEQMLSSPRADAASWAGMSLQFRYFKTAEAGRLFYQNLEKCLDSCGVPRRVQTPRAQPSPEKTVPADGEQGIEDLRAEILAPAPADLPENADWRVLDLAERIEFAAEKNAGDSALKVYALCLLYGFRGALYGDPALLSRVRSACRRFFPEAAAAAVMPGGRKTRNYLVLGERIAFVAVPILVCILFALYCGGILANAL